ncbi:EVE domain-containing protein [Mammaliicoccus stepanovicii]|uniref:EVE domain protein n=1 Tax=Mammaliicoccus stepanovicii TaxID=643214 RepID=A0A239YLL3_9STAP|nr:EVE domain-containing protein [Mammaliicoccus stepanovicii]PNZ75576.1 EVE domain-containing protein [Mammaliicoccus stepanovicii]GGI41139.1 EVE domain-containing protein [Mammaliicoccus stepanovicii]SNV59885.1 EVE domain protein [Mammaliicoccus stepanovicii]
MSEETNYFWLNCGYNRWNHTEPLEGQVAVFESGASFNPTQGFHAFKTAKPGDKVIYYQVQNQIGLLGYGEIVHVQTGGNQKVSIHFKFEKSLMLLSIEYLKRSELLESRIKQITNQLFNRITKDEFDLIIGLGLGEIKIPRYFLMSEEIQFEEGENYTIFTHTVNGIKRNGYLHYTQLEIGDQIVFLNKNANYSIIGVGEVTESIHKLPPQPGRTDSTCINVKYERDINPVSVSNLNKHQTLKKLFFLQESSKQSIANLTKAQYEAMMEMSNGTYKAPSNNKFEMNVHKNYEEDTTKDKPIILMICDNKEDGMKRAKHYVERELAKGIYTTGHPDFSEEMLYGRYLPNESGALYYREGFITGHITNSEREWLVIDQFERIDPEIFQLFLNVLDGHEMTLPRYNHEGKMVKWSLEKDSFYKHNPKWRMIGLCYGSIDDIKEQYSHQFLKHCRVLHVG